MKSEARVRGIKRNKTDIFLLCKESKRKKTSRYEVCELGLRRRVYHRLHIRWEIGL